MDGAGCRCHADGQGDVLICRCEEVSEAEIDAALDLGLNSLDEIKKFTRAGMGLCQGRTCQHLVAQYVARALGRSPAEVSPARVRPPVRLVEIGAWTGEGREETDGPGAVTSDE